MFLIFSLLFLFGMKHYICDYLLQGKYMLGKFNPGWDFVLPLASHCIVHFVATFLISMIVVSNVKISIVLALFDFVTHFFIDRIKASPKLLGRFKNNEKEFWWSLGLDQELHHYVQYTIIFILVMVHYGI